MPFNMLILGASYGSLLATKLLMAGHDVTLVCLPEEADLINAEGTRVRLPVRGESEPVVLDSRDLPGKLRAVTPGAIDPADYDLVGLAMQEPQYGAPAVKALLAKVGRAGVPCMSIMNMPPLPYLRRIPGIDAGELESCFTDASVWSEIEPAHMTLCSPDPQAFRPPEERPNVLQVTLPTNFKVARFDADEPTSMLRQMQQDIEAIRYDVGGRSIELPVKLKVHESIFVPLAKWAMLLTGNYRCVTPEGARSIKDAVHGDPAQSREVYDWVREVCVALGASPEDLVPFEKYANAAQGLVRPSSAARALYAGAANIERVDRVVQILARQKGMNHPVVDRTVELVDAQLEENRRKAAA
ncbi:ketopantoate reductase family protein [Lutibaculum baratangense]|uniref:Ketopantoate reductase N-terminal domain-containing protein n=1 Tax=Lutibaculum baratangense AMV1 TaxID=631454 RepID=V4RDV7_9HYPH|nr:hypothetical protein [Lutibaculum baratangense]ESR23564.1 hypothetical protein N177_3632 [Lutibaculum baratangense AMV1]